MSINSLGRELKELEVETFEVIDIADASQDMDGATSTSSCACSTTSCCSCSTSSCCGCTSCSCGSTSSCA
ncbi:thiazolylpeptide-type bacteriocin [Ornithinimicrobium sp. F0845]|uniref:Thiazolylpeptide-type bacteriocin n=1 Tax=Ornithinimicrobium ciconiae TaxID=2594265 RepID=A0A516G739_9MICO|nr:thiazolylpeptide-type bacteriocin [Ornithinimicrobium sp. F0845]MCK0112068.1 thiazolylpeptide-type bacteriocin [Ornithinimicrobium sp. F0845]QDO87341.1 thiazolylpeptide-type bacteriocin [Ornithinimicrobium ciconiae]